MPRSLADAVAVLADQPDIAQFFRDEGIKGTPRVTQSCPVANYLARETGTLYLSVGPLGAFPVEEDGFSKRVSLPSRVIQFMYNFDLGLYPDLEDGE